MLKKAQSSMNFHVRNLLNIGILSGLTLLQSDVILQYIELALTIAYTIFSFVLSILKYKKGNTPTLSKAEKVKDTIKWLADAMKDGKITKEEYAELKKIFIEEGKKESESDTTTNDKASR